MLMTLRWEMEGWGVQFFLRNWGGGGGGNKKGICAGTWIKESVSLKNMLGLCYTFSKWHHTKSFLHGAVHRSHREPCFSIYIYIYNNAIKGSFLAQMRVATGTKISERREHWTARLRARNREERSRIWWLLHGPACAALQSPSSKHWSNYDSLPPTTATAGCAIGLQNLLASGQFLIGAQVRMAVSL